MTQVLTADVRALGFTTDGKRVALQFNETTGAKVVVEFPIEGLPQLGLLTTQVADVYCRERSEDYEPERIPVWKWEAGAADQGEIGLRLWYPGGGARAFSLSRSIALSLVNGLQEALGFKVEHTSKPN